MSRENIKETSRSAILYSRCTSFLETRGKKVGTDKLGTCTWLIWEIIPLAEIGGSRREVKVRNGNLKDEKKVWPRTGERVVIQG